MGTKAFGRILFWEGASLWVLRAPPGQQYPKTAPHRHHVIQVTLALTGSVEFDGDAEQLTGDAIAIAPNARHAFAGTGLVAHLFVAAEGRAGRQIAQRLVASAPLATVSRELLGDLPEQLKATFEDPTHTDDDLRALGRQLIAQLAGDGVQATVPDVRIVKLLEWLTPRLHEAVSLGDAASVMGVSPGRARHLFVQETGLPFRTYLLWRRLMRALELYSESASLTDAAHAAGFADSAHLSRTFRRMFGVVATSLSLA